MKRSKFSEEQVIYALRQAESGTAIGDICRQLGICAATLYVETSLRLRRSMLPNW